MSTCGLPLRHSRRRWRQPKAVRCNDAALPHLGWSHIASERERAQERPRGRAEGKSERPRLGPYRQQERARARDGEAASERTTGHCALTGLVSYVSKREKLKPAMMTHPWPVCAGLGTFVSAKVCVVFLYLCVFGLTTEWMGSEVIIGICYLVCTWRLPLPARVFGLEPGVLRLVASCLSSRHAS